MAIDDSIRFLEAVFGPFDADGGVPVDELEAAESRLGLALPRALRTLYGRTGRVKSLHATHNRLVAIDEVDFADDHLVF